MKFKIEKKELIFAGVGIAIILLWFFFVKDFISPFLEAMPAWLAVIIYHSGIYIGIFFLSTLLVTTKYKIKFSLITISILAGMDLIDTPYVVSKMGVLNKSIDYYFTTYDAALYSIYSHFLSGNLLWWAIYPISGIILIIVIPILISNPKNIWKTLVK